MDKPTLPPFFVEEHLKDAQGTRIFGVPLTELSHDELLAVTVFACKQEKATFKRAMEVRDMQQFFAEAAQPWRGL